MKTLVLGLGIQGRKRLAVAGKDVVGTVDPVSKEADYPQIEKVPLEKYDAALVCVPDQAKVDILRYLLSHGKHVLVEKPLVADMPTLTDLQRTARKTGAVCYTAYNHRFEPFIRRAQEVLRSGVIGEAYVANFFYGNGTARDVRQSPWRDRGLGVIADLGSHLLDTVDFLLGRPEVEFRVWNAARFENKAFDHAVIASKGKRLITLEMTLLSWRNTFSADIWGSAGSLHIEGLCKWGPSYLKVRKRVLPSGRPEENVEKMEGVDPTWAEEYAHFRALCSRKGESNIENDIWIYSVLSPIGRSLGVETNA